MSTRQPTCHRQDEFADVRRPSIHRRAARQLLGVSTPLVGSDCQRDMVRRYRSAANCFRQHHLNEQLKSVQPGFNPQQRFFVSHSIFPSVVRCSTTVAEAGGVASAPGGGAA